MSDLTPERIAELRELCDKAVAVDGPLLVNVHDDEPWCHGPIAVVCCGCGDAADYDDDGKLERDIRHTDECPASILPALLAALDERDREIERLRGILDDAGYAARTSD